MKHYRPDRFANVFYIRNDGKLFIQMKTSKEHQFITDYTIGETFMEFAA